MGINCWLLRRNQGKLEPGEMVDGMKEGARADYKDICR